MRKHFAYEPNIRYHTLDYCCIEVYALGMVIFCDYILAITHTSALDQQSDSFLAILVCLVVCLGCKIIDVLLNCENYTYHLILLSPDFWDIKVESGPVVLWNLYCFQARIIYWLKLPYSWKCNQIHLILFHYKIKFDVVYAVYKNIGPLLVWFTRIDKTALFNGLWIQSPRCPRPFSSYIFIKDYAISIMVCLLCLHAMEYVPWFISYFVAHIVHRVTCSSCKNLNRQPCSSTE